MLQPSQAKQTRKNFYTNITALFVNIIIGLYYTPYLVEKLGLAAYGILPLALIINQYISVATGTLTSSFTRFYSIEIQKKNYNEASKVLSSSVLVAFVILLVISPLLIYIICSPNSFFNIPSQYVAAARYLFAFTLISFCLALFSSILNVTLYAINRIDLITRLNNTRQILKFLFVILFFELIDIDIYYVGLANFSAEILIFSFSWLLFIRYKPAAVRISLRLFNRPILAGILIMSIWVLIQQVGDTFIYRTDNLVINHFWGSTESGAVGAVSELASYIRVIVGVIGGLFGPLILLAYSEERHEDVQQLTLQQSLIVGAFTAIIAGIVVGLGNAILSVWIDSDFAKYSTWMMLKVIVVPFYAAGGVIAMVYRAWNRVKVPAIWTVILGVVNLVIIILIPNISSDYSSINTILAVSALLSISQCYLLNVCCFARIYPGNRRPLCLNAVKMTFVFIISWVLTWLFNTFFRSADLWSIIIIAVLVGLIMMLVTLFVFMTHNDRMVLKSIVYK